MKKAIRPFSPNLSLHSATRRHDIIESDSNYGQAERFHTLYNYEFSRIIFKLVWARCPPVVGLESAFVFHLMRTAIYYARPFITFWPVILWCRKNSN